MAKKKNNNTLIIATIIAVAVIFFGGPIGIFSTLGITFDDYEIEDDFTIPPAVVDYIQTQDVENCIPPGGIEAYQKGTYGWNIGMWECEDENWVASAAKNLNFGNGGVEWLSTGFIGMGGSDAYGGTTMKYKKNMKNRDIKIRGNLACGATRYRGCGATVILRFNGKDAATKSVGLPQGAKGATVNENYFIEAIKSIDNPDLFVMFLDGEEVGTVEIPEDEMFITIVGGGGGMTLDYLKSRPYFNCEVEQDEISIRDTFSSGDITIDTLTYEPVKLCKEAYPPVLRSEDGVRADVHGEILLKIARGETYTIPEGKSLEVTYIADYVEGMGERCLIDEILDLDTGKCVKSIFEQEDIIVVVRETEFIQVGNNEVTSQGNIFIGDTRITTSPPLFTCGGDPQILGEDWNMPEPAGCWETSVSYKGQSWKLAPSDKVDINNYLAFQLLQSGHWDSTDKKVDKYSNILKLTLKNREGITTKLTETSTEDYFVIKDSTEEFCFEINNKLGANFAEDQAGYSIKKTTDLLKRVTSQVVPKELKSGVNNYCIPIDTDEFGEVSYVITPYIKLGEEIFFDDEQISYNFKVVDEVPVNVVIQEVIVTTAEGEPITVSGEDLTGEGASSQEDGNIILYIAGAIGVAAFLLIP